MSENFNDTSDFNIVCGKIRLYSFLNSHRFLFFFAGLFKTSTGMELKLDRAFSIHQLRHALTHAQTVRTIVLNV